MVWIIDFELEICLNKLSSLSIESETISRMKVLDEESEAKYFSNIQTISCDSFDRLN